MKNIGRTGIFIALISMVLALAGCGGNSKENNSPAAGEEKTQKKADQNQMNPQPRDNVQQGGRLVWPIDAMPANFNYFQIDGSVLDGAFIINAVMPMIFTFDASATPMHDPDYLAGEPKLVSSPKQVVTYELNPKAIWYDGTPITAADYIAQWKAANGTNHSYQISSSSGYDQIETITEGASRFEVVVTFKKPYADWKALFQPLYPASTNNDPKVFNTGWKNTFLTSGGPFKFQGYDATAKIYTIVPNEKWWGNKPKLDSIVFRVIDTDAQPTALASGEIDMMEIGPSIDYYNKAKAIPGVDIRVAGGPNFRHITMNSQSEMLKDVRVRQALAMAIDRSAIAKVELGPLPVVPRSLGNHIFMQNQAGYQDNSSVVSYNPEKAKQLLDAAGWVVKNGKRMKDGKTLIVRLVIPAAVAVSRSEGELIQNMLAQVNVDVNIDTVPLDNFFDKYVTPGRFDFTLFSWMGTQFPVGSAQSIYTKPVGDKIQQNYARAGSDELDQAYRDAIGELDPAKALEKANEVDKMVWAEVHSLATYQRPDIWGVKSGLANIGAYGFASISYEDIGWVKGASGK